MIGTGSGMIVASNAVASGLKTALVESGPMGGTCLNRGCIPSKMLIYPADVIATIREAQELGITAVISWVDFRQIMKRMHELVKEDSGNQARGVETTPDITWFKDVGWFVSDYTMEVGGHEIRAEKIFIVSGARPGIPPIEGIKNVNYLTSDTVLELDAQPKNMVIIGGGYIAAEYGHFFSAMGTEVTIVQRNPKFLPAEEPELSELLKEEMAKRMAIFTNYEAVEVTEKKGVKTLRERSRVDGSFKEFSGQALLVAAGRVPSSDVLKPQKTGVELDERGYIKVNEYLETAKKNI